MEIEEHADLCASHIIEFGDDTCPGEATTSDDCRLERTAEIWIDDNEQNDLTYSTLIKTTEKKYGERPTSSNKYQEKNAVGRFCQREKSQSKA